MNIFRSMIEEMDGMPKLGRSARELGVRTGDKTPHNDVDAVNLGDQVLPMKGLSVSPDDPMNLEKHRRPASLGGTGKDPVWEIDTDDLGHDLIYLPDSGVHGYIAPKRLMTLYEYERALESLRDKWILVTR